MLAINLFHLFKLRLQVLLEGFAADDALGPRELWCELSVRLNVKAKGHEYKRFTNKGHSWRDPHPQSLMVQGEGLGKSSQTSWSRSRQIRMRAVGLSETFSTDCLLVCDCR